MSPWKKFRSEQIKALISLKTSGFSKLMKLPGSGGPTGGGGGGGGDEFTQQSSPGSTQVSVGLTTMLPHPMRAGIQVPEQVPGSGEFVQHESVPQCVESDSATSLGRQVPTARQVPVLPLTSPWQTLPSADTQQTSPGPHTTSVSWIPVHAIALIQTPGRPVDDPVQTAEEAAQMLPSQLDPLAHTPSEVAEPSKVPSSVISKLLVPNPIGRATPGEEEAFEKTVPS